MNIRNELNLCKKVLYKLNEFRKNVAEKNNNPLEEDFDSLIDKYSDFCLVCERLLNGMSILRRYRNGPYFARKYNQKYTKSEKIIAEKAKMANKFYQLDEEDFFIHTRILLDRTVKLSKYFLKEINSPSPISFNRHQKFFKSSNNLKKFSKHREYAEYFVAKTGWFEDFLKKIRDDHIVHVKKRFLRLSGFPESGEFYIILVSSNENPVYVNICDLIRNVKEFLIFFINYMKKAL